MHVRVYVLLCAYMCVRVIEFFVVVCVCGSVCACALVRSRARGSAELGANSKAD